MAKTGSQSHVVRVTFQAPLDFVYRWCTDYSPGDPGLEGESYRRDILSANARRVVYEDLDKNPAGGWLWSHWVVTLRPPDRWHGDSMGSTRDWTVDYRLRPLSEGRTELTLRGRRSPSRISMKSPPRAQVLRGLVANWKSFKNALEADYRHSSGSRTRSTT